MEYAEYRRRLIETFYRYQLNEFLHEFDAKKKTIVLLPGGLGSELMRTSDPFPEQANIPVDRIWIDAGIFFRLMRSNWK